MNRLILQFIRLFGLLLGTLSRVIPVKTEYLYYIFKRAITTGRYRGTFHSFGRRSTLAPGITLGNPRFISIGHHSSVMSHCVIETCPGLAVPELKIGNGVSIGEYSHITCANRISIGDGVLTGRFILITDNAHGASISEECDVPPINRPLSSKGPVSIGNNVWLGDRVTILPDVTIGDGAIIAANAVVTKNIPPYTVAGGNPAKILKQIK